MQLLVDNRITQFDSWLLGKESLRNTWWWLFPLCFCEFQCIKVTTWGIGPNLTVSVEPSTYHTHTADWPTGASLIMSFVSDFSTSIQVLYKCAHIWHPFIPDHFNSVLLVCYM